MRAARWAVFLSGRGSNAEALWECLAEMDVVLCVSSRRKAYGVKRARRLGLPVLVQDSKISWKDLDQELRARGVNRLFLLGYMKILPAEFVQKWQGRMWNLHPSLLPAYPGLHAIEKSYEAGGEMGVTLHEVTVEMDAGPICLQKKICEKAKAEMSFDEAQTKISQTEQRLVREWASRVQLQRGEIQGWM
jgi:phosphoribosylglycinamide formyltransferase-1